MRFIFCRHLELYGYLYLLSLITLYSAVAEAASGIVALTNEDIAAQQAQHLAAAEPTYVDQLIDAGIAEDLPTTQLSDDIYEDGDTGNLRSFSISTSGYYSQDNQQREDRRLNTSLNVSYQTMDYGDFRLQTKFSGKRNADLTENSLFGGHFVLHQGDFLLNEDWTMINTLGVNQNFQNSLLSSSGYVNLTPHTFFGGATRIYSNKTELRVMAGEKGKLTDLGEFSGNGEQVIGVGLARYINSEVIAGGQAWYIDKDSRADNALAGNEFSAFVKYNSDEKKRDASLQVLSVDGSQGVSLAGGFKINRFDHQAGYYQLDEHLHWMGEAMSDGVQGAFWRMSYQHPRFTTNTSLDWQRRDAGVSAGVRHSLSYHLNREIQLGSSLAYSYTENDRAENRRTQLHAHASRQLGEGQYQRLQLSTTENRQLAVAVPQNSRTHEINYTHRWLLPAAGNLDFQFTVHWGDLNEQNNYTAQAGIAWQKELEQGGRLGANLKSVQSDSAGSLSTSISSRFYADYRLNKSWSLAGELGYDRQIDGERYRLSANLQLNYYDTRGQAITNQQRLSGNIRGTVFYDENNDGVRQPLEKVAPGVIVGLDQGGLPQTTDRNGEFEFLRIRPGNYRVGVAETSVPLPWELANSGFQQVKVAARQTEIVSLPLVRLSVID